MTPRKNKTGFTLPEMLVTLAIIAIVIGLLTPAIANAKIDARTAKQAATISAVQTAKLRFDLDPDTTTTQRMIFNQGSSNQRFTLLQQYLIVDGKIPTSINQLTQGTGFTYIRINNLNTVAAFSNQAEIIRI